MLGESHVAGVSNVRMSGSGFLTHYTPGHSRGPHADKPSRYEKGSGELEWVGENFIRSGSLEEVCDWGWALLAPLCCPVGLVWAQLWDVNGMKQGPGG